MIIREENNKKSFELNIVGYQFPDIKNDEFDSNWLMTNIKVKGLNKPWEATDPMLLTFEVEKLVKWFEDILNNRENTIEIYFTEPNVNYCGLKHHSV